MNSQRRVSASVVCDQAEMERARSRVATVLDEAFVIVFLVGEEGAGDGVRLTTDLPGERSAAGKLRG